MSSKTIVTIVGALVIGAAGFGLAKILEKPLDGNPVGFHARGQVQINPHSLSFTDCTASGSCTLTINFDTLPGAPLTCPSTSKCFAFGGQTSGTVTFATGTPAPVPGLTTTGTFEK